MIWLTWSQILYYKILMRTKNSKQSYIVIKLWERYYFGLIRKNVILHIYYVIYILFVNLLFNAVGFEYKDNWSIKLYLLFQYLNTLFIFKIKMRIKKEINVQARMLYWVLPRYFDWRLSLSNIVFLSCILSLTKLPVEMYNLLGLQLLSDWPCHGLLSGAII